MTNNTNEELLHEAEANPIKSITSAAEINLVVYKAIIGLSYLTLISILFFTSNSYADWFNTADVKTKLIDTSYKLVSDNLGIIAFTVGGAATFFARGGDFWTKGIAFGAGAIGTAAGVVLAKSMLGIS